MKYDSIRVYAAGIGKIGNSYNTYIAKPEGWILVVKPKCRWNIVLTLNLKKYGVKTWTDGPNSFRSK